MMGNKSGSLGGSWPRKVTLAVWSVVLVLLVLALASCAKPPEAEIAAAEIDLDGARDAEAPVYAPKEFRAAEDSLAAARSEIDRQNAKFALFRSYGDAKKLAASAGSAARTAAEAGAENKELVRADAEKTLAEVEQLIADLREKLDSRLGKRLARAKGQRQAIAQIRTEIDSSEAALENVRQAQAEGRFADAARIAREAKSRMKSLDDEVGAAIAKMTEGS